MNCYKSGKIEEKIYYEDNSDIFETVRSIEAQPDEYLERNLS